MDKSPVVGEINCILHARSEKRQMELSIHPSRAIVKNEIHELILTDESEANMGQVVNRVAYLGFFEVVRGGIILVGDKVEIDGEQTGHVAGFDFTHFPNHINLCIRGTGKLQTGYESGIKVGSNIIFRFEEPEEI
jgi:uncharacterized protein YuzE